MTNIKKAFEIIISHFSKIDVDSLYEDQKLEYVDYEQMKDEGIEDEFEYYSNYCTREAADDIIEGILIKYAESKGFTFSINEHCKLYDLLQDYYDIILY